MEAAGDLPVEFHLKGVIVGPCPGITHIGVRLAAIRRSWNAEPNQRTASVPLSKECWIVNRIEVVSNGGANGAVAHVADVHGKF